MGGTQFLRGVGMQFVMEEGSENGGLAAAQPVELVGQTEES